MAAPSGASRIYPLGNSLAPLILLGGKLSRPKLEAIRFWYEFYFDTERGSYVYEIETMHRIYHESLLSTRFAYLLTARSRPNVYINPYKLHVLSDMDGLTTFVALDSPSVLEKLQTELKSVVPEKEASANLSMLEPLPYLNADINEGLRLGHGTMHRLSRVHSKNMLNFNDWIIPPSTPIAMTPYFLHLNPTLLPETRNF